MDEVKAKTLFAVFFGGLIAGILLCLALSSQAMTIRGDHDKCVALARDATLMAKLRDAGATWEKIEPKLRPQVQDAINDPESYIEDKDDFQYTMDTFKLAMTSTLSPYDAATLAFKQCMIKAPHQT